MEIKNRWKAKRNILEIFDTKNRFYVQCSMKKKKQNIIVLLHQAKLFSRLKNYLAALVRDSSARQNQCQKRSNTYISKFWYTGMMVPSAKMFSKLRTGNASKSQNDAVFNKIFKHAMNYIVMGALFWYLFTRFHPVTLIITNKLKYFLRSSSTSLELFGSGVLC